MHDLVGRAPALLGRLIEAVVARRQHCVAAGSASPDETSSESRPETSGESLWWLGWVDYDASVFAGGRTSDRAEDRPVARPAAQAEGAR